jgi:poly-gamma-glutamate synthesis protein (capsule biosynthesis protein)
MVFSILMNKRCQRWAVVSSLLILLLLLGSARKEWSMLISTDISDPVFLAATGAHQQSSPVVFSARIDSQATGLPTISSGKLIAVCVVAERSPLASISAEALRKLIAGKDIVIPTIMGSTTTNELPVAAPLGAKAMRLYLVNASLTNQRRHSCRDADQLMTQVATNTNAIGLLFLHETSLRVRILPVDGWHPTRYALTNSLYPFVWKVAVTLPSKALNSMDAFRYRYQAIEDLGISFLAGGDMIAARGVENPMAKNGWHLVFTNLQTVFNLADIVFCNLESPISSRGMRPAKKYHFRTPPEALPEIAQLRLNIVSLANNHSMDYGMQAFTDTLDYLRMLNISFAGFGQDRAQAITPALANFKGKTFGVMAYSRWYDGEASSTFAAPIPDRISNEVASARQTVDNIIVSVHDGDEYQPVPEDYRIDFSRRAIDGGALAVIGHHPHWPQGYEIYQGRPILYSLGNLVFDQNWNDDVRTGFLAEMHIIGNEVRRVLIEPMYNNGLTILPMPQEKRESFFKTVLQRSLKLPPSLIRETL